MPPTGVQQISKKYFGETDFKQVLQHQFINNPHQQTTSSKKSKQQLCLETYDWASALSNCGAYAGALNVLNQCFVLLYINKTSEYIHIALL